jgi:hypothetical protein
MTYETILLDVKDDSFLEKRAPQWKLSVARDKPDLLSEGGS